MALEIIVLIVLALVIGLVGIGMVMSRLKKAAGYAGTKAGNVARSARQVGGGYVGNASRYARSKFPQMDPDYRLRKLSEERNEYEEWNVSRETGPITALFSVLLNVGEYFTIGGYLKRKQREAEGEATKPTLLDQYGRPISTKGRKK